MAAGRSSDVLLSRFASSLAWRWPVMECGSLEGVPELFRACLRGSHDANQSFSLVSRWPVMDCISPEVLSVLSDSFLLGSFCAGFLGCCAGSIVRAVLDFVSDRADAR